MIIALDYDGTYTEAPELWEIFIRHAKIAGHEVICVTMRYEEEPVECSCKPYYTGRNAKIKWCEDNGVKVDIWIDDNPHWLFQDSI